MITQSYIEGLNKQIFIKDYLLNGLFPCQSSIVRGIRSKSVDWGFNHRFEYRMLLAITNTPGTVTSQMFNSDVSMKRTSNLDFGTFQASYGVVQDGMNIDMTANLETEVQKASFERDYALRVFSLRMNLLNVFKNIAIHGRFGVVHQMIQNTESWAEPIDNIAEIGNGGLFTPPTLGSTWQQIYADASLPSPQWCRKITVPYNVFASNLKKGMLCIHATGRPDGVASVAEAYVIVDNQPNKLTLAAVPNSTPTTWAPGDFLEIFANRKIRNGTQNSIAWGGAGADLIVNGVTNYEDYTDASTIVTPYTGAMEGLADLFPWYTDTNGNRLGIDTYFRGQTNRLVYTTEQAGQFVYQGVGERIIDTIMQGVALTKSTVPFADVGIWMNPYTRLAIGYQEGNDMYSIRQVASATPIVRETGITETKYYFGTDQTGEIIDDYNLRTDVIIIGPKNDLSYNCWDSSYAQIDKFLQETGSKEKFARPGGDPLPNELLTSIDFKNRVVYGQPVVGDYVYPSDGQNTLVPGFVHPSAILPMKVMEMGALFTENPYCYTIIKLRKQIVNPRLAGIPQASA